MAKIEGIRKMYSKRLDWEPPERVFYLNQLYVLREKLRYGDNPHQGAALYTHSSDPNQLAAWFEENDLASPPSDTRAYSVWEDEMREKLESLPQIRPVVGEYELLKTGKKGPSGTNIQDVDRSVRIVSYFDGPACATPKHVNPSGVAVQTSPQAAFECAYACDSRAAFGSFPTFNCEVDEETAVAIMESGFIEGVAAPEYGEGVLEVFKHHEVEGKRVNTSIRVLGIGNLDSIPKYVGDDTHSMLEPKLLCDGSLILQQPYLSQITPDNYRDVCQVVTEKNPTEREWNDLLFGWRVAPNVRSNGVVIAHNEMTIAVGTGQQERIGAIDNAIWKAREKGHGYNLLKAVLASDGFMLWDNIVPLHRAGISAVIQPGGGKSDEKLIAEANKYEISMVFTGERVFSH